MCLATQGGDNEALSKQPERYETVTSVVTNGDCSPLPADHAGCEDKRLRGRFCYRRLSSSRTFLG